MPNRIFYSFVFLSKIFTVLLLGGVFAWGITPKKTVSLDFVDATLSDVARSLSIAYDTPILVDDGAETEITLHLDSVGLLEGLSAICSAHQLEVVEDGRVFHIRRLKNRGESEYFVSDSGVSFWVKGKNINDFVEEYAAHTGLNILVSPGVSGNVWGKLRNMPAELGFQMFLESQGFGVSLEAGCLHVFSKSSQHSSLAGLGVDSMKMYRDDSLYSVNFSSVPLSAVLKKIASVAGLNLAMYGDMQDLIHLKFDKVPLRTIIETMFKGSRYTFVLDSANLFVAEAGIQKALSVTELYPLKFVDSEKALSHLLKFLPSKDFVVAEVKEQNALLLGGSLDEITKAKSLIKEVDIPTLQVTLSCVIVEFKRGKNFEMGFRNAHLRKASEGEFSFHGFFNFMESGWEKTGAFGKIGLLPEKFELELLSLEENNLAEVLARPRLTTLNGNKAELNVTNTVYYLVSQVSADGYPITDYRSFNDGISLELTPIVTQGGNITLNVAPEIKTAGRSSGDGPRDISTRNLNTTVVLHHGETLCLGGLMRKNSSKVRTAIPFLGSIPLVGRFFSYESTQEESSELAIFITPEVSKYESP